MPVVSKKDVKQRKASFNIISQEDIAEEKKSDNSSISYYKIIQDYRHSSSQKIVLEGDSGSSGN